MNKIYFLSIISLIITTFFWGTTFIFVKQSIMYVSVDGFLTVRFLIAFLILLPIILFNKSIIHEFKDPFTLKLGFTLGFLLYTSFLFQTEGLKLTSPSKAAFITGLSVILVPILGFFLFSQKLKKLDIFASIFSLIGLSLMTLDFTNISNINIGDALILVTAVCVAFHVLFTSKVEKVNVYAVVIIQFFFVFLFSLAVAIFRHTIWIPKINDPTIIYFTLFLTSFFATAFAFLSQTFAQKNNIKTNHVAVIFALEPVFALLTDIFYKNYPSTQSFVGMLCILFSMIVLSYYSKED